MQTGALSTAKGPPLSGGALYACLPVRVRQTTVQVSPPPISAASRSAGSPGAASRAVAIWARAWSSYVGRSTWRKMPIGDWLR